jgi:hypothetical protein
MGYAKRQLISLKWNAATARRYSLVRRRLGLAERGAPLRELLANRGCDRRADTGDADRPVIQSEENVFASRERALKPPAHRKLDREVVPRDRRHEDVRAEVGTMVPNVATARTRAAQWTRMENDLVGALRLT